MSKNERTLAVGALGHRDAETLKAGTQGGKIPVSQGPSVPAPHHSLIDLPHGGYRKLIAWRKGETIY